MAGSCLVRRNRTIYSHCGIPGHLAKVCFAPLQCKPKAAPWEKAQPLRAIMGPTDDIEDQEPWVNRLRLNISHRMGSFTFNTFPDTGSAATLIAANLAQENNIQPTKPSHTKYINMSGDPVPTMGTAPIQLSTSRHRANTNAVITPAVSNEIIIGREDLKQLGVIPRQFPNPVFFVAETLEICDSLIINNHDVLTDDLPRGSMDAGCISMKIHLTPGEKKPFRIITAHQIPLHWKDKADVLSRNCSKEGL